MARRSSDETRENQVREELAALLRRARTRIGWSQTELQVRLAEALGVEAVAPNTISRYERGVLAPTLGTLDALCTVLGGESDALVRAFAQALGEADAGDGATKVRTRRRGR
ncbi:MAG: helix-turn-helix transcriptional regulator [Myxococcales bacterium]|nr:helix-turn-helix transcriptional regulator [Myxococcales bacterium]